MLPTPSLAIDRAHLEALVEGMHTWAILSQEACRRSAPDDRRVTDLRFHALRPGSLFDQLGLRNGDTLEAINGLPALHDPDRLSGASRLDLSIVRGGRDLTLAFRIHSHALEAELLGIAPEDAVHEEAPGRSTDATLPGS